MTDTTSKLTAVRAKFQCQSVEDFGSFKTAKMSAVYGTSGENADFTKSTPSGRFEMNISTDVPASDFFEPGESYYLDITKAPKPEAAKNTAS